MISIENGDGKDVGGQCGLQCLEVIRILLGWMMVDW